MVLTEFFLHHTILFLCEKKKMQLQMVIKELN